MTGDGHVSTIRCGLQPTNVVRTRGDEERLLEVAIRQCVKNATRQPSPRNRFERFVTGRLQQVSAANESPRQASQVTRITDELRERLRNGPSAGTTV